MAQVMSICGFFDNRRKKQRRTEEPQTRLEKPVMMPRKTRNLITSAHDDELCNSLGFQFIEAHRQYPPISPSEP
jgi:hypothetical protein